LPPRAVKTIQDLIFWQYAKIISESAGYGKKGYTVTRKPFDVRCGKFAVLADPDGNELPIIDLTKFGDKPRYDK